jgi:hypothetical protein
MKSRVTRLLPFMLLLCSSLILGQNQLDEENEFFKGFIPVNTDNESQQKNIIKARVRFFVDSLNKNNRIFTSYYNIQEENKDWLSEKAGVKFAWFCKTKRPGREGIGRPSKV